MKKIIYKYIFSLFIILLIPVIITGCSNLGFSNLSDSGTIYSLRINEAEYNFYDNNNQHEDYEEPIIKPEPGETNSHESGTIVDLFIEPNDFLFIEWQGDKVNNDNGDYSIVIDSPKIITPVFGLAPEDDTALVQGGIEINHNFPYSKLEDASFYETSSSSSTTASTEDFSSQSSNLASNLEDEDVNELIIRFEDFVDNQQINEILADLDFEEIDQIPELNSILVKIPDLKIDRAVELAEEIQGVRYAEPNQSVQILNNYDYNGFESSLYIPDDPQYKSQWHYPLIRLPQTWSLTEDSASETVRIAVLDTGIDAEHEDLESHIDKDNGINVINYDDENNDKDFDDNNGHGTHLAGTIGAVNNNSTGVSGIFQDIEIIPIKALDEEGEGSISDIVKGISYAAGLSDSSISERADIINMSFGIESSSSSLKDVIKKASDNNVILVSASGNNPKFDEEKLVYPAAYQEVISVGSVSLNSDYMPERSDFSNYSRESSPKLDFVAPGLNIYSTLPGNESGTYGSMNGTSMAAPHVTGLIGLMLSQDPELNFNEIKARLERTSMKINDEGLYQVDETGYGLINAYWAINDVQDIKIILGETDILNGNNQLEQEKIVAQRTIPLEDFYEMNNDKDKYKFSFNGVEPGDYRLIGLIDVNNSSTDNNYIKIEPGDYFFTENISLQADKDHEFNIKLEESTGDLP